MYVRLLIFTYIYYIYIRKSPDYYYLKDIVYTCQCLHISPGQELSSPSARTRSAHATKSRAERKHRLRKPEDDVHAWIPEPETNLNGTASYIVDRYYTIFSPQIFPPHPSSLTPRPPFPPPHNHYSSYQHYLETLSLLVLKVEVKTRFFSKTNH